MGLAQALRRSIESGCCVMAFLEHPEYRELVLCGGRLPNWLWEFSAPASRISDTPPQKEISVRLCSLLWPYYSKKRL
jgi:hypothetical protein